MKTRAWAFARRTDWVLWGALLCTLVGTAHAEYTLAVDTGMNKYVAVAVPGALDLYVIRALQTRRDVLGSVAAMVAVNVTGHLVQAREIEMHWGIVSAVGALAPLVLWRVHYLWRAQARVDEYVPEPDTVSVSDEYVTVADIDALVSRVDTASTLAEHVLDRDCVHPECDEYDACTLYPTRADVDTLVSAMDTTRVQDGHVDEEPVSEPDTVLKDTDTAYLGALDAYLKTCKDDETAPTLRGAMGFIGVGQDRARRLLKYAGHPEETQ